MLFPSHQSLGFYDIIEIADTKYIVLGKGKLGILSDYKDDTLDKMRRKFITLVLENSNKILQDVKIDKELERNFTKVIRNLLSGEPVRYVLAPANKVINHIEIEGTYDNLKISVQMNNVVTNVFKFENKIAAIIASLVIYVLSEDVSYMKNIAQGYNYILEYLLDNLTKIKEIYYTSESIELSKLVNLAMGIVIGYKQIAMFKPKFGPNMNIYSGVFVFGKKSTSVSACIVYPSDTEEPSIMSLKKQETRSKTMKILDEYVYDKRLLKYSYLRDLVFSHLSKKYSLSSYDEILDRFEMFMLNSKPRIPRDVREVAVKIVESDILGEKSGKTMPAVDVNVLVYALGKFFDHEHASKYKALLDIEHCNPSFKTISINLYPNPVGFVIDEVFGKDGKIESIDDALAEFKRLLEARNSINVTTTQAKNMLLYVARIYLAYAFKLARDPQSFEKIITKLCGYMHMYKLSRGKKKKQVKQEVSISSEDISDTDALI